jgi:hypothetical protein
VRTQTTGEVVKRVQMRALGWVRVVGKRMLALWWFVRAHLTRGRWFVGTQTMGETGLGLWGHKSCGKGR